MSAVDMDSRGNLPPERGVASEGDVDRTVDLFVLEHVSDEPGLRVRSDAELGHGPSLRPNGELFFKPSRVRAFELHGETVFQS